MGDREGERAGGASLGKANTRGFSLIEMMVAIVVFSILAAAGTAVLNASLESKGTLAAHDDRLAALQVARTIMKSDFGQAAPRPVEDSQTGFPIGSFVGSMNVRSAPILSLVRRGWGNPGMIEPRGSLQFVQYKLEEGALIRQIWARTDAARDTPVHERVLLDGISKLTLSFFANGQWRPEWFTASTSPDGLPAAVAVEMELEGIGPVRQVFLVPGGRL